MTDISIKLRQPTESDDTLLHIIVRHQALPATTKIGEKMKVLVPVCTLQSITDPSLEKAITDFTFLLLINHLKENPSQY